VTLTQCHFSILIRNIRTFKFCGAKIQKIHQLKAILSYKHTDCPLHLPASNINPELLANSTTSWNPIWKCPDIESDSDAHLSYQEGISYRNIDYDSDKKEGSINKKTHMELTVHTTIQLQSTHLQRKHSHSNQLFF
jgi:hypothetical protein